VDLITEEEMYSGEDFIFGQDFLNHKKNITWNPDGRKEQNPHLMIIGGSGSGKTRLAKQIIKYLQKRKKVNIIDFHGDIHIPGENLYVFKKRNGLYGLNFFDFSKDTDNGGPAAEVLNIISLFKKNIFPKLGDIQRGVLYEFLMDCYRYKGIFEEDENSWGNELPTVHTMIEIYELILNSNGTHYGYQISEILKKIDKETLLYKQIDSADEEVKKKAFEKIAKLFDEMNRLNNQYYKYLETNEYASIFEETIIKNIHISKYNNKTYLKTLESIFPYIKQLESLSIFSNNTPPEHDGIVRFDISGFTNIDKPMEALLFSDLIIQRKFRECKMKGEYDKRGDFIHAMYGEKCYTFVVVDESKLLLPYGQDKENPFNIINRLVTESRKFGFGLIIISQRLDHFPEEMVSSIFTKVILKVSGKDRMKVESLLGKTSTILLSHVDSTTDGVCIVGNSSGQFKSVRTPFFKE